MTFTTCFNRTLEELKAWYHTLSYLLHQSFNRTLEELKALHAGPFVLLPVVLIEP